MKTLTTAFGLLLCAACAAQSGENVAGRSKANAEDRLLFLYNFLRGYADFEVAPPHNERDLGLCPQHLAPLVPGVQNCADYARYVFGLSAAPR